MTTTGEEKPSIAPRRRLFGRDGQKLSFYKLSRLLGAALCLGQALIWTMSFQRRVFYVSDDLLLICGVTEGRLIVNDYRRKSETPNAVLNESFFRDLVADEIASTSMHEGWNLLHRAVIPSGHLLLPRL